SRSIALAPYSQGGPRLRVVGRIDDIVWLLAVEEPQYVRQGRLHRARSLPRDHRRDMRRHDDVGQILKRTVERPTLFRVGVRPPGVQGGTEFRVRLQVVEQVVLPD